MKPSTTICECTNEVSWEYGGCEWCWGIGIQLIPGSVALSGTEEGMACFLHPWLNLVHLLVMPIRLGFGCKKLVFVWEGDSKVESKMWEKLTVSERCSQGWFQLGSWAELWWAKWSHKERIQNSVTCEWQESIILEVKNKQTNKRNKTVTMASQFVGRTGAFFYFNHSRADGPCMLSFELALPALSPKEKAHSMWAFPFLPPMHLQGILMGKKPKPVYLETCHRRSFPWRHLSTLITGESASSSLLYKANFKCSFQTLANAVLWFHSPMLMR